MGHRRGSAFDGRGSLLGRRLRCLVVGLEVEAGRVGHRGRPVRVRTRPDIAAGASNCPANVVNTAAIEDCVADTGTSAGGRAFRRRPVRRGLAPSCSRRACAADAAAASDSLELPCRLVTTAAGVDPAAGDHRKEDDSGTQLSNGPAAAVAAAIAIGYRGLDYYYYYLIDSALAAAAADLELGSDYWRGAAASVNFADQLPAT